MLAMPRIGNNTTGKSDVTPRGTASEIHHTNIQAAAAKTRAMSMGNPASTEIQHTKAAKHGPDKRATTVEIIPARI
jgi:hypothetical protein